MSVKEKVEKILAKSNYNFDDLCLILEILRGEGGCPWDAEQTHESIRKNFIEETYEVIEAIDTKNPNLLKEELGDVMLQVVFHTQMEKEAGRFDINDVTNDVCTKLVHRHPHIFGEVNVNSAEEVLKNWEAIKNEEKKRETMFDKLNSIPPMTPALMRASKVVKKSCEYKNVTDYDLMEKIKSSLHNIQNSTPPMNESAVGELLFLISALSLNKEIDPEEALYKYTNQFIDKYK